MKIKEQIEQKLPRFMKVDEKAVYTLFDAFVKATLLHDKVIDFGKPMVTAEDGSLEFVEREQNFSDLIRDDRRMVKPVKKAKKDDKEENAENAKKAEEFIKGKSLLYAHIHWLWSLGAANAKTSCGAEYLEGAGIEKEEGAAFTGKTGLWKAPAGGKFKDMDLICNVLYRYATTGPRVKALFTTVDEIKGALANLAGKALNTDKINMRNGLLHLCDPNSYVHLYTLDDKLQVVAEHGDALKDFVDPYNKADVDNMLFFRDEKLGYRIKTTEAQLCHISDVLASRPECAEMSQEEFWTRYFYPFEKKSDMEAAVEDLKKKGLA